MSLQIFFVGWRKKFFWVEKKLSVGRKNCQVGKKIGWVFFVGWRKTFVGWELSFVGWKIVLSVGICFCRLEKTDLSVGQKRFGCEKNLPVGKKEFVVWTNIFDGWNKKFGLQA